MNRGHRLAQEMSHASGGMKRKLHVWGGSTCQQQKRGEGCVCKWGENKWACRSCKWKHKCACMGESLAGHACGRVWAFGYCFFIGLLIGQMGNGLEIGFNGSWIIGLKMTR